MTNLIPFTTPNSKKELFARLREILSLGWINMPEDVARYNGTGGPGNFLEDLIGLNAGNKDIADIIGWEVKYFNPTTHLITLFHKEPQPEGVLRYMVNRFGWIDKDGRKSFRHTIRGKSDRFIVADDAGNIIVRPLKGNGIVPMWTHDQLLNIAGGKLRRLMLVRGERRGRDVRFHRVDCFENLHLTLLIAEIINGTIAIDFDAREAKPGSVGLRNHGTKFRVAPDHVCRLYLKKERLI
ncbi:MAG TPA: MvaI/BcnI family restriction endonuclease [Pyrinomonadaceae bacterium]|nr:MvaI/BcnI family restriction endonuclease [Pyrinomonadaceae bacterium]